MPRQLIRHRLCKFCIIPTQTQQQVRHKIKQKQFLVPASGDVIINSLNSNHFVKKPITPYEYFMMKKAQLWASVGRYCSMQPNLRRSGGEMLPRAEHYFFTSPFVVYMTDAIDFSPNSLNLRQAEG